MAGTKELQEIVKFVIALGNAIGKSLEDGKFSLKDLTNFWSVFGLANAAVGNWKLAIDEVKDLDAKEIEQLVNLIKAEMKLGDAELKARIELGFDVIKKSYDVYKLLKNYF